MTQQQMQHERPKQAPRTAGELVIAVLDLLFGLPLTVLLTLLWKNAINPTGLIGWLMVTPFLVIALGLVSAGLLILLRQYRLARAAQWLAALGGVLLGAALVSSALKVPPPDQSLLMGLGAFLLTLAVLFLLPRWLRKVTED